MTMYLHWNQGELTIEHPDSLPPDKARAVVMKILKSGRVPPIERDTDRQRGRRAWHCEVKAPSGPYTVTIRRDSVTIEPADACEEPEGLA